MRSLETNNLSEMNFVVQELNDETSIQDLKRSKTFCLNGMASFIWRESQEGRTVEQIRVAVEDVTQSRVTRELVVLGLSDLKRERLLPESSVPVDLVAAMPRREWVKKATVGITAALPIIVALSVSESIQPQSCPNPNNNLKLGPAGCPCMGNNDCVMDCAMMMMTCD